MYFADTPKAVLWRFDNDIDTGVPSNRQVFATFDDQPGAPDGSCVDAGGCLWNAQWNGSRVVRYTPSGRVDRILEMPTRKPTCVTFGGDKLDTLYITPARYLTQPHELEAEPLTGAIFAVSPDVTGLASEKFVA
jgi:L-arabinonolactonase